MHRHDRLVWSVLYSLTPRSLFFSFLYNLYSDTDRDYIALARTSSYDISLAGRDIGWYTSAP